MTHLNLPPPEPILIGQSSIPEDFKEMPASNSFITILHNNGEPQQIRYDSFVALLFKHETVRHMLDHARCGMCEEAGEAASVLKKHLVYGQPLDRAALVKELGDLRFYIQAVTNLLHIPEQEILQENANKLAIRYKQLTYTKEEAQERADESANHQSST